MRTVVVVCVITASAFIGPPVWAQSDHVHVPGPYQESQNFLDGVGGPTLMAQTFTANWDGILDRAVLCHVEIGNTTGAYWGDSSLEPSPPVVEIRDTFQNEQGLFQPGSTILGSVTWSNPVPSDGWTLPIPFLDQGIVLTKGVMYSIVLWADDYTGAVSVGATTDDSYLDGALWKYVDDGKGTLTWLPDAPLYDMQFRTYVVPVPLPAGVWLGVFAVSVAGWHLKRQRV